MATWFIYTNRFYETRRIRTDGRVFEFTPGYLASTGFDPSTNEFIVDHYLRKAVGITHPRHCMYNKGSWNHTHIRVFDIEENEWRTLFKHRISKYGPLNLNEEIQDVINELDNSRRRFTDNFVSMVTQKAQQCLYKIQSLLDPAHYSIDHYTSTEL
jgi:hypothetical protein